MPTETDPHPTAETTESFADALSEFEQSHAQKPGDADKQIEGTVVSVTADSVLIDIGYKTEGILPLSVFQSAGETVQPGNKVLVSVKGRDPEGYYSLSRGKLRRPADWPAFEKAFADKATIIGTVTGVVKGGLNVDVGVRAFMPASRSGAREAGEMEKLVGEEIRCRIIKVDVQDEDVVVDRRVVLEEEEQAAKDARLAQLEEGATVTGTVRSLTNYGAFVDIGGVDALLHVGDLSWARVNSPADVLSVGQEVAARVLKISADGGKRRISIGVKQMLPDPWEAVADKYKSGERVRGTVSRTTDFGAFVELEPGVEGLIHISEMSWSKRVRKPDDVVKPGEQVEAVVLSVSPSERRIGLGLKQALGDPWADIAKKFAVGSQVEGPISSITKFGAFVTLSEGIEGMIHVSEISAEKRINHPQDVLKTGQIVQAQIVAIDSQKRQLRLSMKQLVPTSIEEYIAEHKAGDLVSGRVIDIKGDKARVELGDGIQGTSRVAQPGGDDAESSGGAAKVDVSALGSMLSARWKGGASSVQAKPEPVKAGQIRSFKITHLEAKSKTIELELAG
jgi:small subunit ribosomal protein S1